MRAILCSAALVAALSPAFAEESKYQKMVSEDSPAELFQVGGEELWKKAQGPKHASLEKCDLGKGPGVLKGAYAALPRYFKDTDRVMDLETRLLYCMETLQGRSREEATKRVFGNANSPSEMEYLSAYIASKSRGVKMNPGHSHPKEKAAFELGRALFFHRAGAWDFSCASCHGEPNKRIRMSQLPVLDDPKAAAPLIATWPAYRVSNSQFKTMQWRINDCYRQMRMPEPTFASDATVAMNMFLATMAKGETYRGPGTKR